MTQNILWVFLGGGLGSIGRFMLSKYLGKIDGLPFSTFLSNIIGCFVLGLVLGYLLKNNLLGTRTYFFLATGFCGGFTTFSTFTAENFEFLKNGDFSNFLIYTLGSFILGLALLSLGFYLTKAS